MVPSHIFRFQSSAADWIISPSSLHVTIGRNIARDARAFAAGAKLSLSLLFIGLSALENGIASFHFIVSIADSVPTYWRTTSAPT
jgi:hypothetical protein